MLSWGVVCWAEEVPGTGYLSTGSLGYLGIGFLGSGYQGIVVLGSGYWGIGFLGIVAGKGSEEALF